MVMSDLFFYDSINQIYSITETVSNIELTPLMNTITI